MAFVVVDVKTNERVRFLVMRRGGVVSTPLHCVGAPSAGGLPSAELDGQSHRTKVGAEKRSTAGQQALARYCKMRAIHREMEHAAELTQL